MQQPAPLNASTCACVGRSASSCSSTAARCPAASSCSCRASTRASPAAAACVFARVCMWLSALSPAQLSCSAISTQPS